jgi:thiol-disulfide isomerase/thioredoxin
MLFSNFHNNVESKCPFCRATPCSDFPVLQQLNTENQNVNYDGDIDSDEELNHNNQIIQIIRNLRNQRTVLRRVKTELNQIFLYDTIVKIKTIMVIMLVLIVCTVILIEEVNKKIKD